MRVFRLLPIALITAGALFLLLITLLPAFLDLPFFYSPRRLSITDGLTHLYNRRYFEEFLARETASWVAENRTFSLAMADIDHFKRYNDAFGHLAGDEVLREVGRLLKRETRGADIVARYGGEEFVVVFSGTGRKDALGVCRKLAREISALEFPGPAAGRPARVTVSIGVAGFPEDGHEPVVVLRRADTRLYRAKQAGRDRVIGQDDDGLPATAG